MATEDAPTGTTSKALPAFEHTPLHPKTPHSHARSIQDTTRRHSLPLHFLPPALWSSNTSTASLVVESEEAARGEHILDEATVAHRINALRQLNGATRSGHRYAKSTGARNSTFSQPVIVRTYSGASRPPPQQRSLITVKKGNGLSTIGPAKMDLKLPPVEAFSFKGIMDEIRNGVNDDLERIAEICARSKYSLSNQYEVHMPPHGRGEAFLPGGYPSGPSTAGGPTLQAVGSDDETGKQIGRGSRGGRRTKSVAYGTLETIMSSSRSSDEDKSKKKPAAVIADEVRGRAAKKEMQTGFRETPETPETNEAGPSTGLPKHTRSKSATFASVVIDNAQGSKHDMTALVSPNSLTSEPARPQTSTAANVISVLSFGEQTLPTSQNSPSTKPAIIQNESRASNLKPDREPEQSIFKNLSSWLPWKRPPTVTLPGRLRSGSHAEGSLRNLLKSTDVDPKGKAVDRNV